MSHQEIPALLAGLNHQNPGGFDEIHHGLDLAAGPSSPAPSRGYRVRRRNRPTQVSTGIAQEVNIAMSSVDVDDSIHASLSSDAMVNVKDIPLPTIEHSAPSTSGFFIGEGFSDEAIPTALPDASFAFSDPEVHRAPPPRTPSPNMMPNPLLGGWSKSQFGRSDSSDSLSSLASSQESSYDSGTWSATPGACSISPESEADPAAISKDSSFSQAASQTSTLRRNSSEDWTPEMDRHIWKVYNAYLEDPTVTPYKFESGTTPPSGVSHRIARKVRRTWSHADVVEKSHSHRNREPGSGSVTPKASMQNLLNHWPKSGNATRDRLRTLCQRFGAPDPFHVSSRSMSPFLSTRHSPTPRLAPFASSLPDTLTSNFAHDVRFSLMTSTSDTMQLDGPLARLATEPVTSEASFHVSMLPPVPFASPAAIPSSRLPSLDLLDMDLDTAEIASAHTPEPANSTRPRLGSPFPHHNLSISSPVQAIESNEVVTPIQSSILQSPIRLEPSLPESKLQKRRATNDLDDSSPPHHASLAQAALIDVLGPSDASLRRRVRARGQAIAGQNPRLGDTFSSLSQATTPPPPLAVTGSLSNLPLGFALARPVTASTTGRLTAPVPTADVPRRLLSPFEGINGRPTRPRGPVQSGSQVKREPLADFHDAFNH